MSRAYNPTVTVGGVSATVTDLSTAGTSVSFVMHTPLLLFPASVSAEEVTKLVTFTMAGLASLSSEIKYTPRSLPSIMSVSPDTVSSSGGSQILITVANLGTANIGSKLQVVFGGATAQLFGVATVQSANVAQLTAVVVTPDLTELTMATTGMVSVPLKVYWNDRASTYASNTGSLLSTYSLQSPYIDATTGVSPPAGYSDGGTAALF